MDSHSNADDARDDRSPGKLGGFGEGIGLSERISLYYNFHRHLLLKTNLCRIHPARRVRVFEDW